ncbi:replication-relaxation family protein [Streptomyces sp. NPDC050263]|uniref:replication-relaxation family protein n=1 Tax=Streptomyces sp. NPDC050263 TaxID=3155037 RepID=UPI003419C3EB
MATTEQMHRVIAPSVRIEQTRRRLARLRAEGVVDRITLPQAGRTRGRFPTSYGVQLASEWPELRGRRLSRTVSDPTAVRLKAGHTPTVTETALVFLEDARRREELCEPLDWIPEVRHPIGSGEAVIPYALLYYRRGPVAGDNGSMLRAFVEVDRATMGPRAPGRQADRVRAPLPLRARARRPRSRSRPPWRERKPGSESPPFGPGKHSTVAAALQGPTDSHLSVPGRCALDAVTSLLFPVRSLHLREASHRPYLIMRIA